MAPNTKPPKTTSAKRSTFRRRDHHREYQMRIAKGEAAGKSRSAARGHWRAQDLPKPTPGLIDHKSPLERALKRIQRGSSQKAAAAAERVSVEKLRRHRLLHTASQRVGNRLVIFDSRPQAYWIVSDQKMISVTLANDEGGMVSAYWRAVDKFLNSNDAEFLDAFEGEGVTDIRGRFYQFETRPNALRKLDAIGELNFIEIYADTQP